MDILKTKDMKINKKLRSKVAKKEYNKICKELDGNDSIGIIRHIKLVTDMIYWSQWIY